MEDKKLAKNIVSVLVEICGVKNQDELAKKFLGIKPQSVSTAIARGKIPFDWIKRACTKYGLKPSDIMKKAYAVENQLNDIDYQLGEIDYQKRGVESSSHANDEQFSITEMITMTAKILESKTVYRSALASNIRAFHQAVTQEGEMQEMRNTIAEMQRQIQELREIMLAAPETGEKKPDWNAHKDADRRKAAG